MRILLAISFTFCCLFLWAQKVCFEYDLAGNQIVRELCINDVSGKAPNQTANEEPDFQKFFPEDVISYYPNPVKEELFLKWNFIKENKVTKIEIYNLNGQSLATFNRLEKENSTIISFAVYPVGIYQVVFYYTNQEQKSIRIVKK